MAVIVLCIVIAALVINSSSSKETANNEPENGTVKDSEGETWVLSLTGTPELAENADSTVNKEYDNSVNTTEVKNDSTLNGGSDVKDSEVKENTDNKGAEAAGDEADSEAGEASDNKAGSEAGETEGNEAGSEADEASDNKADSEAANSADGSTDKTADGENGEASNNLEDSEQYEIVISKCNEYVNIRELPTTDSEIVGRLYKNSYGIVLEREEGWTKISSGDVTGYVNNGYLYMDEAAKELINKEKLLVTKITAGTVNIRSGAGTQYDILKETTKGTTFPTVAGESKEGWNAIEYDGKTAYVSAEYSEETILLDTALTKAQAEEKDKAIALAKALESAKHVTVTSKNREAIEVSDEEIYLLATVIASEALSESYEGKLAVANVIINRMLNGYWGTTVSSVVYAPGQFSGSATGRFEKFEKLMTEDCKKAAVEALAGHNNIDDFLYFRMKDTAVYEKYSKYYILGNHCFYMPK